jgi:putative addiction module component (TIGR02574 family)
VSLDYPKRMALAALAQEFDALPLEEQLDVVQTLWERIARRPDLLPTPEWHLQIVRDRLAAHVNGSEESVDWDEFRKELLSE